MRDFQRIQWMCSSFKGYGCVFKGLDNQVFLGIGLVCSKDLDGWGFKGFGRLFGGVGYFVLADTKMQNRKRRSKLIRFFGCFFR